MYISGLQCEHLAIYACVHVSSVYDNIVKKVGGWVGGILYTNLQQQTSIVHSSHIDCMRG